MPTYIGRENARSEIRSERNAADESRRGETQVPDSVRDVIASSGTSLDTSVQRAMEDRMGDSLGDVRIHTGPQAANACEEINARAFTVGNHIAFDAGEYDPESQEGQHVLAHELAHVRQQTGGAVSMLPQEDVELEIDPDPALEREAEETAQRVVEGEECGIQRMGESSVHIQRFPDEASSGPKKSDPNRKQIEENGGNPRQTRWSIRTTQKIPGLDNEIVWLEESGWQHILERHEDDFIRKYESVDDKSDIERYIQEAIRDPDETGLAKGNKARFVYKIHVENDPFWVIVGSNGFIQSAYPSG